MKRLPIALTLATALLLSACSSDDRDSTIPNTTEKSRAASNDQVLADYRAFWDDYLAVTNPMSPGNPRISAHTTGDELAALNGIVIAGHARDTTYKGSFELHPRVQSSTDNSASVNDCYIDKTGEYKSTTGERLDQEDLTPRNVTATLALIDGVWKVSAIDRKSEPCSP